MKTIMACVDFSPVTNDVLERAFDLAKATGSKVCLIHVVAPLPVTGPPEMLTPTMEIVSDELLKSARRQLETIRAQVTGKGIIVKTLLFEGVPSVSILSAAAEEQADLIVIGSHGLGFLRRVFLGSTVMGVLKGARCPVVVVPLRDASPKGSDSSVELEVGF